MSKMHRVAWIDSQIRGRRYPNSKTIADQFNISSRQAARDIEYLRDSMCAPIEYCYQRKGFFYAEETFTIPNLLMTEQQKQGLSYLTQQYRRMEGEYATHMANLFSRLLGESTEDNLEITLPAFPMETKQLNIFHTLSTAIQTHKKVFIRYVNQQQLSVESIFSPYKLYTYRNDNYVVGYCDAENIMRFFALKDVAEVGYSKEAYDLTPLLKQANIVPNLINEPNVAIVQLAVQEYVSLLQLRATPIAPYTYHIEYYETNPFITSLLNCPCDFTIISPCWLRNLIQNKLKKILKNNAHHDRLCHTAPDTITLSNT